MDKTVDQKPDKTKVNDIKDDNIGGAAAGGVAGTGGVSTNDVGSRNTKKQPLTER